MTLNRVRQICKWISQHSKREINYALFLFYLVQITRPPPFLLLSFICAFSRATLILFGKEFSSSSLLLLLLLLFFFLLLNCYYIRVTKFTPYNSEANVSSSFDVLLEMIMSNFKRNTKTASIVEGKSNRNSRYRLLVVVDVVGLLISFYNGSLSRISL